MKAEDVYCFALSLGIAMALISVFDVLPMGFTFQVMSGAFGVLLIICGSGLLIKQSNNRKQRATF